MAEVKPADDAFTEGSTAYGSYLVGYLGFRPTTGGYSSGTMYSALAAPGIAFFTASAPAGADNLPIGQMRREEFPEDVFVRMAAFTGAAQGAITPDVVYRSGVAVRIQGGTLAGDKSVNVRLDNVSCYAAEVVRVSAFTYRLDLNRYSGGSRTTLASSSNFQAIGNSFLAPFFVRLSAQQDGSGDVALVASISGLQTVQFLLRSIEVSHVDSSGSKITGAGRCGMILDRERQYSSNTVKVVSGAVVFEVGEMPSEAVLYRDEFRRAFLAAGAVDQSEFGFPGFSLASDYSADGHAFQTVNNGTPDNVAAKRDAGNNRIIFSDTDTTNRKLFCLSQRLADDPRVQHRQTVIRFSTISQPDISAGLLLRGSTNGFDVTSYQLRLFPGLAGAGRIALIRARAGQNDVEIAGVSSLTIAASTPYTLRLEVYPRDGANVDGPAVLKFYLDGVQQIPTTAVTDGSIEILASGDVIDQSTAVVTSGPIEGLRVSTGSVANAGIILDEFDQLTLNDASVRLDDLPELVLRDESERASGTLVLTPDWDVVLVSNRIAETFEDCFGGQSRWSLQTGTVRQFEMTKRASEAERDTYAQFFDDHKGREIPFTWDPSPIMPRQPVGLFRFLDAEFERPKVGLSSYLVRMSVEEVL